MCWNKEVSFLTGTFGIIVSFYLFKRNKRHDRWFSVVLLTVTLIQWAEFILWYDLEINNTHKTNLNYFISVFILPFIISLQPLASLFGTQLSKEKFKISTYIKYIYIVYVIGIFIVRYNLRTIHYSTVECMKKKCSNQYSDYDTYLKWNFLPASKNKNLVYLDNLLSFGFLVGPLLLLYKQPIFYKLLIFHTLLIPIALKSGSRWCLYGNIGAIIFLLEN